MAQKKSRGFTPEFREVAAREVVGIVEVKVGEDYCVRDDHNTTGTRSRTASERVRIHA